jgi:hypothetical protein
VRMRLPVFTNCYQVSVSSHKYLNHCFAYISVDWEVLVVSITGGMINEVEWMPPKGTNVQMYK